MDCLNCGIEILKKVKKRRPVFCGSTCRSNYWQKAKRLKESGKSPEEIAELLSVKKTNIAVKPSELPQKSNETQKEALSKGELKEAKIAPKIELQDLNKKSVGTVNNLSEEKPKTNYTVNTQKPFMSDAIKKKLGIK